MSRQSQREVVLQADNSGQFYAFGRLEGVLSYGRPDVYFAHLHVNAEILQSSFYNIGVGFDVAAGRLAPVALKQAERGRDEVGTALFQISLYFQKSILFIGV